MVDTYVEVFDIKPRPRKGGGTSICSLKLHSKARVIVFIKGGVGCKDSSGEEIDIDSYIVSGSNAVWDADRFRVVPVTLLGENPSQLKLSKPERKVVD